MDKAVIDKILDNLDQWHFLFEGYRLVKKEEEPYLLGKGGYSSVYEMEDVNQPQRHYALKVIGFERYSMTVEEFNQRVALQRILGENSSYILEILATKSFPIEINEDGELEGVYEWNGLWIHFVLMEKADGLLSKDKFGNVALNCQKLMQETEVLRFAKQIGQALLLMHQNHILHRDIKLENIYWDEEKDLYKLGDFGVARYVPEDTAETMVYTDGYGAPEIGHIVSENYNVTADIYSFGMVLYLLLNNLCFPGSEGYYVNMVQYSPEFVFPATGNGSAEINRVIRKMCSFYPQERYQSIQEVLAELNYISERGNGAENSEVAEMVELATETYREPQERKAQNGKNAANQRIQRKWQEKAIKEYYGKQSFGYTIVLSLLVTLFLWASGEDGLVFGNRQFLILPVLVLAEAFFLQLKEFHIFFGGIAFLAVVFSIIALGISVPHIILLCSLISGVAVFQAAGAIGTALWLGLGITGVFQRVEAVRNLEPGWLILGVMLWMINEYIFISHISGKLGERITYYWMCVFEKLPWIFLIVGLLSKLCSVFQCVELPNVLDTIHLIPAGILLGIMMKIEQWQLRKQQEEKETDYGYLDQ